MCKFHWECWLPMLNVEHPMLSTQTLKVCQWLLHHSTLNTSQAQHQPTLISLCRSEPYRSWTTRANNFREIWIPIRSLLIPVLQYWSLLSGVLEDHMTFPFGMPMPSTWCSSNLHLFLLLLHSTQSQKWCLAYISLNVLLFFFSVELSNCCLALKILESYKIIWKE